MAVGNGFMMLIQMIPSVVFVMCVAYLFFTGIKIEDELTVLVEEIPDT